MLNKKLLLTAAIALSTIISSGAFAVTQDVGASVTAHGAMAISNVQDINFGHIDYDVVHSGGVRLGTDGNIIAVSGSGLVLSGNVNPGTLTVASDGTAIEISCETTATLANENGDILSLGTAEITNDDGVAFGDATRCRGIGSDPLITSGLTELKIGGQLVVGTELGGNDLTGGTYSTANAGGVPLTVSVVYQ